MKCMRQRGINLIFGLRNYEDRAMINLDGKTMCSMRYFREHEDWDRLAFLCLYPPWGQGLRNIPMKLRIKRNT